MNTCQTAATIECRTSNRSNAIWNGYTCQTAATIECPHSNQSNAIWNSNTCQTTAIIECIISNWSNRPIKSNNSLPINIGITCYINTKCSCDIRSNDITITTSIHYRICCININISTTSLWFRNQHITSIIIAIGTTIFSIHNSYSMTSSINSSKLNQCITWQCSTRLLITSCVSFN